MPTGFTRPFSPRAAFAPYQTPYIVAGAILINGPADQADLESATVHFVVDAYGAIYGDLRYQWQMSSDAGGTWFDIVEAGNFSGTTTADLQVSNIDGELDGYLFRCVVDDTVNSATSRAGKLTILPELFVVTGPDSASVLPDASAEFTVFIEGETVGMPSFQWQISTDGGSTWTNIDDGGNFSGALTATLVIASAPLEMDGNQFRCRVSDNINTVTSNVAVLTVAAGEWSITGPEDASVFTGDPAEFTIVMEGSPVGEWTYQWQVSTDDGDTWGDIENGEKYERATTTGLDIVFTELSDNGSLYRCRVSDDLSTQLSDAKLLTVTDP